MGVERGAAETARDLATVLEASSVSYAIGGALALAVAGVPRGTLDVDLERLVAVRPELDRAYVRRWIVDMMGEDDERTRRWDVICERFASD